MCPPFVDMTLHKHVLGVNRVGLGFKDVLDTIRVANMQGELNTTDEDVHIII